MSGRALHPTVAAGLEAARAAGEIALRYYRSAFEVTIKADQTPVTQADREAEQAIKAVLRKAFPHHGFLGEEFGEEGNQQTRWIIDPIDGTKNFVRHVPVWAVLIGLEEDGDITTGVVLNPVSGTTYWAHRGDGAFADGRPIRVSDLDTMDRALLLHSSLNLLRRTPRWWEGFVRMVDACDRTRGYGDYVGYGLVAEGKAEVYVEADLKPWDLAPMKILVEEAGGRLTDFRGRSTIYDGTVVASNGRLHEEALRLLGAG